MDDLAAEAAVFGITLNAQQTAQKFGIRSIPTLLLFRDGKEAARVSGALPLNQLKAWLEQQNV